MFLYYLYSYCGGFRKRYCSLLLLSEFSYKNRVLYCVAKLPYQLFWYQITVYLSIVLWTLLVHSSRQRFCHLNFYGFQFVPIEKFSGELHLCPVIKTYYRNNFVFAVFSGQIKGQILNSDEDIFPLSFVLIFTVVIPPSFPQKPLIKEARVPQCCPE